MSSHIQLLFYGARNISSIVQHAESMRWQIRSKWSPHMEDFNPCIRIIKDVRSFVRSSVCVKPFTSFCSSLSLIPHLFAVVQEESYLKIFIKLRITKISADLCVITIMRKFPAFTSCFRKCCFSSSSPPPPPSSLWSVSISLRSKTNNGLVSTRGEEKQSLVYIHTHTRW